MKEKFITKRKRGFFGWVFLTIFWLFQAFMVFLVFANFQAMDSASAQTMADCAATATDVELCQSASNAGVALGGTAVAAAGWFVWILGTIILGLLVLFSRGKSVTYET